MPKKCNKYAKTQCGKKMTIKHANKHAVAKSCFAGACLSKSMFVQKHICPVGPWSYLHFICSVFVIFWYLLLSLPRFLQMFFQNHTCLVGPWSDLHVSRICWYCFFTFHHFSFRTTFFNYIFLALVLHVFHMPWNRQLSSGSSIILSSTQSLGFLSSGSLISWHSIGVAGWMKHVGLAWY